MVSVPERVAVVDGFAVTANWTVRVPVVDVADVMLSQLAFAAAVHAQVEPVVTVTDPVEAVPATENDVADRTGVHGVAPACVIVTVCPATVSVPLRCVVAVFAVAAKATVLVPVTCVADVIDSQLSFAAAVHAQAPPAVTRTVPVDAVDPIDAEPDESTGAHGAELVNSLDIKLAEVPPGPTASTRA